MRFVPFRLASSLMIVLAVRLDEIDFMDYPDCFKNFVLLIMIDANHHMIIGLVIFQSLKDTSKLRERDYFYFCLVIILLDTDLYASFNLIFITCVYVLKEPNKN